MVIFMSEFFQMSEFIGYLGFWLPGILAIWGFGCLGFWLPGFLAVWIFGQGNLWTNGLVDKGTEPLNWKTEWCAPEFRV